MRIDFDPRAFLHVQREKWRQKWVRGPVSLGLFEFVSFGIKQAWACLFGALMLFIILTTYMFYPEGAFLPRYDFITICAILIQFVLILTRLETLEEVRVILVFHIVGTAMEIFKTQAGSWIYPEPAIFRIGGVPLFSGFMYACVGSYMARAWRIFDFRFSRFPPFAWQALLAVSIYLNFFSHHFIYDFRYVLFLASLILFGPAMIWFKPDEAHRPMPLIVGLLLVAFFIWLAENIGTFARAWVYPGQENGWQMVSFAKYGSWYLLMLISFVLVVMIHRPVTHYKTRRRSAN